jgi:cytochrome c peroxidase
LNLKFYKLLSLALLFAFIGVIKFARPVAGSNDLRASVSAQRAGELPPVQQSKDENKSKPNKGSKGGKLSKLDSTLMAVLSQHGFTGSIESTLEDRLGRRIDAKRADLGRQLWFDTITALNKDNSCSGCHAPTAGFGDTQSIAIGIESNGVVGRDRRGPRNQRRTPMAINTAFFPTLMWNSRFFSLSGDPFDNSAGFQFPLPEGLSLSNLPHLLVAQAHIPPVERNEAAGFDFPGDNFVLRTEVMRRLNENDEYRKLFGQVFGEVRRGAPIDFEMFGKAIAEFEFTLTFADAPIDKFARGDRDEMTDEQKKGALLFFGKANCAQCHTVAGNSNEMFSDFKQHVVGVPQIFPRETNSVWDGEGGNEDFGLEQVTQNPADRYLFRTSPLRNVALQPTFFHNGSFNRLEDAVRHHLNVFQSARGYTPARLDRDLTGPLAPIEPVLARLDSLLVSPVHLTDDEFRQLVEFVRGGLLDPRAKPENLRKLIPKRVPSGRPVHVFQ